ncbi:MAG: 2-amino-4-hydroxy-6-hydroxymethyldihydropteridine diphosphokinase [Candidatus Marinimicrobia bacterium]|nr:2-amino-4-hydroxy-6-hydroxymethyldihydropteridine diphosphokinase [Candidatus Neomarinimicrobiota bacterium]|tara:strand:- start:316 stop:825 length:510 start_codon:yes stop_codon:yes gene_type:complete
MNEQKVYLSLGSNIGDRESNLAQATMALSINFEISNIISSSYYDTEPLYNTNQPHFLNSVVKFSTTLKPFDILDIAKKVETMLGRPPKRKKNQPRIIDIDILFHGDAIIETEQLSIPHPMVSLRKFILIPFAEIEPEFQIPHSELYINDLIENCPDTSRVIRHYPDIQA